MKRNKKTLLCKTYIKEEIHGVLVSHNDEVFEQTGIINFNADHDTKSYSEEYYWLNNRIICIIKDEDGFTLGRGSANCHIDDSFNLKAGMALSRLRAMKRLYESAAREFASIL